MTSEHQASGDQKSVRQVPKELLEDLRSRVIHYVSEAKNFSAEIHQVAGKPPQLALSLDGNAVSNPSNIVAADNEKTNQILVQNIPASLDEEFLELFFESKKKKGGGPVKHVKLDREKHWAIVEFYEPDAVDVVLSKRPIAMLDTQVDIQPYLPLLSSHEHLTSLDIQGLPIQLTEDLLASQLNSILNPSTLLGENHQDELSSAPDERITETMTDIREIHLRYIQVSDFKKRMTDKFPNLSINILPKRIIFDGHASEIEAAKVDLNAVIDNLSVQIDDKMAWQKLEVIQSKEAGDFINSLINSLNLVAVWEVDQRKLVCCGYQDSVRFCQRIIAESVKQKIVATPPDSSILYSSKLWTEFLTSVTSQYKGLLKIYLLKEPSAARIVATENILEEAANRVQIFLAEHAIVRRAMTADGRDNLESFQKVMEQACLEWPNHFLRLVSCNKLYDYRFLFTLEGTTKGINQLQVNINKRNPKYLKIN